MEKQGMGRSRRYAGPRLLALLLALLSAGPASSRVSAQDGSPNGAPNGADPLIISVETSPDPQAGLPWIVVILVDHPAPAQVEITLPSLPAALSLESIRTGGRVVERYDGSAPGKRCTQVELRFIPAKAGPLALPPVTVRVPEATAASEWLRIDVGGVTGAPDTRLVWEGVPSALSVGEEAVFALRMRPPPSGPSLPEFHPDVPKNALLEELPLDAAEKAGGLLLKLRLIPLDGPELSYRSQTLRWEGVNREVPGWRIRIRPPESRAPLPAEPPAASPTTAGSETAGLASPAFPPFPDTSRDAASSPGGVFNGMYTRILDEARGLWDAGSPAAALARLRRAERDELVGWALARPRRIVEDALGLGPTGAERWRPRALFFVLATGGFILPVLAIMVFLFCRFRGKKTVTSRRHRGYRVVAAAAFLLLGAAMLLGTGNGRQGIVRETGVYRVPELQEPVFIFREGEPVQIRSPAEAWMYVESFDGRTGWVPQDALISY